MAQYISCGKSKPPPPGRGQYALALILGIIALAMGGISLWMNASFGLKSGVIMAAIFVGSDSAKIVLPMVAVAYENPLIRKKIKVAYYAAISLSLMAAVSYLLETQSTRLLQSRARETAIVDARVDAARLRQELGGVGETSSTAALDALARVKAAAVKAEAANGGCMAKCQERIAEHEKILERLGQAKRRDRLEAELAALTATITGAPAEAVGASATIAGLTGSDADAIARHEAIIKMVAMLIILELLASFSGESGNLFISTWRARRTTVAVKPRAKAAESGLQPHEKPAKSTKNYWMERLAKDHPEIAAKVIAGRISCYKGCIEAGLRKQPAKERNLMKIRAYANETPVAPRSGTG